MLQAQRALPRLRLAPVHHRILGEMQGSAESDFATARARGEFLVAFEIELAPASRKPEK